MSPHKQKKAKVRQKRHQQHRNQNQHTPTSDNRNSSGSTLGRLMAEADRRATPSVSGGIGYMVAGMAILGVMIWLLVR